MARQERDDWNVRKKRCSVSKEETQRGVEHHDDGIDRAVFIFALQILRHELFKLRVLKPVDLDGLEVCVYSLGAYRGQSPLDSIVDGAPHGLVLAIGVQDQH